MAGVSLLLGKRLEQVVKDESSWGFSFSGGLSLWVGCLWRLIVSGRIVITSEDHGHQFGLPAPVDCVDELRRQVGDSLITRADLRAGTVDIALDFGEIATLEVIANSAGYEAWVLNGPDVLMVGQPGYE